MAASIAWRKHLNDHPIFEVLSQSKEEVKRFKDCRGFVEVRDGELYLWNAYNANLLTTNLKCLGQNLQRDRVTHQSLLCTNAPIFDVEQLVFNDANTFVALVGRRGLSVLQLPQRTGKYAEYAGGKKKINCRTVSIGERLFVSNTKLQLLHAAWHPASLTDSHLVLLTSDNVLRIYDVANPQDPIQTHSLTDARARDCLSSSRTTFNLALGETAVSFDFGPETTLEIKSRKDNKTASSSSTQSVWPIYILWGNGDVYSLLTSLDNKWSMTSSSSSLSPSTLSGPLTMHPPAEDNYGTDACSVMCLPCTPPVLVVATCGGKLYHCVVLPALADDADTSAEHPWESSTLSVQPEASVSLYVFESIELELSLTTVTLESDDVVPDDFSCPIRLHKDPSSSDRYHCSHSAGVHSVVLPWIYRFQEFVLNEKPELPDVLCQDSETIVEHLICTKPLPTSPPSPVLGVTLTADKLLGPTLLCLTSSLECITLPLLSQPHLAPPQLLSESPMKKVESPLKRVHKEPFDEHIRKTLKKNASNPLLRGASHSDLPPQELFQLLSRSTQVFREERIQKLDLARQEIERRVRILKEQRDQQFTDLQDGELTRNILTTNAEALAEKYEDISDKQQSLMTRLEAVLRQLQMQCGDLTVAERNMQKELTTIETQLKQHKNSIEQLRMKQTYQSKQLSQHKQNQTSSSAHGSPGLILNKPQTEQIRQILKQEGDQISEMVAQVNNLKLQLQA